MRLNNSNFTMRGEEMRGLLSFIAAGFSLVIASQVNAFEYKVDYFQVGDQIDQFDGSGLVNWEVGNGTVVEVDGQAIIKSPGDIFVGTVNGYFITHEESDIDTTYNSKFKILIGSGNATATSKWLPSAIPSLNELYRMAADVDFFDENDNYIDEEYFFAAIINADPSLADFYQIEAGLNFVFVKQNYGLNNSINISIQYAPISILPSDDILLRLLYDDEKKEFSAVYSLDGGIIFQDPFAPFEISDLGSKVVFDDWDLGGESFNPGPSPVPVPAPIILFGTGLAGLVCTRLRRKKE
ncbi:MAG: hypothetical protein AB1461_13530 [Thermodesulfobacteriota bacterium]